jgi:hypothetical protein
METTQIELLGITVTEPFTWITNWCVAAASFYFGHLLYHNRYATKEMKFWAVFFLFMGSASITGGTAHGFINYVGHNFHYAAWIFSGFAVYGAQRASLEIIREARIYPILKWFILIEVVAMTISVVFFQSFESVRVNSAFGLIGIVLPIQLYAYRFFGLKKNGIIAIGILSNIAPAIIHAVRFSYNRWFNFNDLSHVVMIVCFYIMYRGAALIEPKKPIRSEA